MEDTTQTKAKRTKKPTANASMTSSNDVQEGDNRLPLAQSEQLKASKKKRKPSTEDNGTWNDLYMYVRNDIFNYPENIPLSNYCVMRLKGMAQNVMIAQDKQKVPVVYGYVVVQRTMELYSEQIKWVLSSVHFHDEKHKVNYIMKIVESHITDVALWMYKIQQAKNQSTQDNQQMHDLNESLEQRQTDVPQTTNAANTQTTKTWRDKYDNMW